MKNHMKGAILDQGTDVIVGIVLIGFLLGAGAIGLTGLQNTQPAAGAAGSTYLTQFTVASIANSSSGLVQFALQMPNIGTIGGIAILLIVLLGAFYMFLHKG